MLEKRVQNEDPKACQARLQRMRHAEQKLCPGKRGSKVFEWEESIPGYFLRVPVERSEVETKWDDYSEQAKVYDSLFDEWDLWWGFDEGNGPTTGEIDELRTGVASDGRVLDCDEWDELYDWVSLASKRPFREIVPVGERVSAPAPLAAGSFTDLPVELVAAQRREEATAYFQQNADRLVQMVLSINADPTDEPDMQWTNDRGIIEIAAL